MIEVRVTTEKDSWTVRHDEGRLLVGRAPGDDGPRVVVPDERVSRRQLAVELLPDGAVRLENLGKAMRLDAGGALERNASLTATLPIRLHVGRTTLELTRGGTELLTIAPPMTSALVDRRARPTASTLAALGTSPPPETLARWFETLVSVQAAAASSDAFHEQTARAVVDLVGLDRGLVLLRDGEGWRVTARHARPGASAAVGYSRTVVGAVSREGRTFYETPDGADLARSLAAVQSVVASPVLGEGGRVEGVVYGSRDLLPGQDGKGVSPLEAQLVQLLASSVSVGVARLEQELEAARLRVQFEQFFSPTLARELEANPSLLDASEREITVLFSDVRGFSAMTERLGARRTYELCSDLLDRLTDRVLEHGGIVVDYYGDGLEAAWNAPTDQPDHAERACRAALAMQAELPALDERWAETVGEPLRVGIGLHAGRALVGNAGSRRRLKYGPRGHVVNLASRIEGATKRLAIPVLVSGAVRELLPAAWPTRRLGRARAAGVEELVELHELGSPDAPADWLALRDAHAEALAAFEAGRFEKARRAAESARELPGGAGDVPLGLLLQAADAGRSDEPPIDLTRRSP